MYVTLSLQGVDSYSALLACKYSAQPFYAINDVSSDHAQNRWQLHFDQEEGAIPWLKTLGLHVSCVWVIRTPKIIPLGTWKLKHNSSHLTFTKIFLWKFILWILRETDINCDCTMKVLVINNLHFKLTPSTHKLTMLFHYLIICI